MEGVEEKVRLCVCVVCALLCLILAGFCWMAEIAQRGPIHPLSKPGRWSNCDQISHAPTNSVLIFELAMKKKKMLRGFLFVFAAFAAAAAAVSATPGKLSIHTGFNPGTQSWQFVKVHYAAAWFVGGGGVCFVLVFFFFFLWWLVGVFLVCFFDVFAT